MKMTASKTSAFPLIKCERGQKVIVSSLPRNGLRTQFIRLGIHEGERLTCYELLPGGTIVVKKHRQQIAIGEKLAREILVTEAAAGIEE